jgi:hypothetical protein
MLGQKATTTQLMAPVVSLKELQAQVGAFQQITHDPSSSLTVRTCSDMWPQLDSLLELCPGLPPAVVPQGFDVEDLWGLADTEGERSSCCL